jgi:hypothetical protein
MVNETRGEEPTREGPGKYRAEVVISIILKDGGNLRLGDHIVQG